MRQIYKMDRQVETKMYSQMMRYKALTGNGYIEFNRLLFMEKNNIQLSTMLHLYENNIMFYLKIQDINRMNV